jgi:hypothetical protein
MYSNRYLCHILLALKFSRHIFEKYSNIKFNENSSSGSPIFFMRTDKHDETNSLFSQFRERA